MRFLLTLFLLGTITGCQTHEKPSQDFSFDHPEERVSDAQIFRLNLHSEPASLDPRLVRDIPSLTTSKMFFDGLMRSDIHGKLVPSVASLVTISDDKKTYTFRLKQSLWSNGSPVTAFDFEYAWKKALSPQFPAEYAYQLFILRNGEAAKKGNVPLDEVGVFAADARTLVVELEHNDPYFLQLTSFPICFPINHASEIQNPFWASEQGDDFISNGPFRLVRWDHSSELSAERNPFYWDASHVKLENVVLTMIEDEHTELNMYENDELDWAGSPNSSIPPEALPTLKDKEELFIHPIAGTYCFKFNTKATPFDSLKMRKAFAYAINRKSLIDNVLQANQLVATSLLPPCMKSASSEGFFCDGDRQKAVQLFEEALEERGWSRETLPDITLIFSKSEKHQKLAQAIQQEWNQTFDIRVNLQSYEWNTYIEHLAKHDYQVGGRGWISDLSDPKTLLEIYKFSNDPKWGGNNDTQWEDPEFIRLIDEAEKTVNSEIRQKLLLEAEKILIDEMPIAPLYHSTACYLKKSYVKNIYMSELCDLDLKNTYIDKSEMNANR